jgi:hypothetical protein
MRDELTAIGDGIGAIETLQTCDVSQVKKSPLCMLVKPYGSCQSVSTVAGSTLQFARPCLAPTDWMGSKQGSAWDGRRCCLCRYTEDAMRFALPTICARLSLQPTRVASLSSVAARSRHWTPRQHHIFCAFVSSDIWRGEMGRRDGSQS